MKISMVFPLLLMGCSLLGGRNDPQVSSRGSVCGDPFIKGEVVGEVEGERVGCGIANAVRVTSVGGVLLSQPSVMECNTARAFNSWVRNDVDRILGIKGGGVEELQISAHYVCRTRNHRPGGPISEHGKGKAIDIAAFRFQDGTELSVEDHWGRGRNGRLLKRLHRSACGPFGTVLGPEADRHHKDHFHFDTAEHRGGSYCR